MNDNETDHISSQPILSSAAQKFGWIEYSVFSSLLGVSLAIGIYYGFIKKNQNTTVEYLLAGKSMKVWPVAASLVTSHVSGVSLLGVPSEIYDYGTSYLTASIGYVFVTIITNIFILPVFYPLQLTSLYEYLELRFSKRVRKVASLIFASSVLLLNPVILYVPSLAFHQATGISIHHFAPVICLICVFYTAVGGLKTVVWTDTIQGVFTVGSSIIIVVMGIMDVGGFWNIFQRASAGHRIEFFNMNPNPLVRSTFWTMTIGGLFHMLNSIALHPGSLQRFMSIPTMELAKRSVYLFNVGLFIVKVLTGLIGLTMFAKYYLCDPVVSQGLKNSGELVPYYVQDIGTHLPGLTGVFISGLISAALSTISANLNTMSGTLYEDLFSTFMTPKTKETRANITMKITVIIAGISCMFMMYVVEHLGTVLQMGVTLHGITQGAITSVFLMGLFLPWVDEKGAIWGMICSVISVAWLVVNNQLAIYNKHLKFDKKPMNMNGCHTTNFKFVSPMNTSMNDFVEVAEGVHLHKDIPSIYALSYFYYNVVGILVGFSVAALSTLISRNELQDVDPALITPMLRPYLPEPAEIIKLQKPSEGMIYTKVVHSEDHLDRINVIDD